MRTAVVCVLALAASATAMYSSNEELYESDFDEDLYARQLEVRNKIISLVGQASGLAGIYQSISALRQRSDDDLEERELEARVFKKAGRAAGAALGHAANVAGVGGAVAVYNQPMQRTHISQAFQPGQQPNPPKPAHPKRRSDEDLWARAFDEYDQLD
ncbi:hypothetical protein C8Q72DRAFT_799254 [Fomitopsis betulina]|nr:hypothetical protein C8Q72DRAFT_799254 [Fomitopsis betulina]